MTSKPTSVSRKRSKRPPAKRNPQPPEPAVVAFARFAKQLGLRWYVFGAQAVNLYGFPRATADLDVTVALGSLDPSDVVAKLRKAKFTPRFKDAAFIAATRVIPVVHDASASPIDIVLAGPGLEEQFLDEVVFHSIGRIKVPVLSIENLIVTKLLAGRLKDLEDIRELLPIQSVDHARVEGILAIVEAALDQSDLRVLYRRLRAGS
jgi:predicted nucleotidyltransferase